MAVYGDNVLTKKGKELLAKSIVSSELITFTKVEFGKGVSTGNLEELTDIVESFKVLSITSSTTLENGGYRIRTTYDNTGLATDTYLKELGVYARGEDGVEILYSYCSTTTPDLIPSENAGPISRVEDVNTYISNATNINAVIDQTAVYATIKDLNEGLALKEPNITKKTAFNLDKVDDPEASNVDSSFLLATGKALKKVWNKVIGTLAETVTNKNAIQNNKEQIENLSYNETLIFDGNATTVGEITLSENWDNFHQIVTIADIVNYGNNDFKTMPTDFIIPSDHSTQHGDSEITFTVSGSTVIAGKFRDTDRTKLYISEVAASGRLRKVIGINRK